MAGLIVLGFAYVLSQFFRVFLAVLTPDLTLQLGVTKADLALASGVWFATFALMQFAVGVGLDRYGPRRTAALLFGFAGAGGVFAFAAAQSPLMIIVAMGLIGIGCAPVLMASLYLIARRFDAARFALWTSAFIGIGSIGNIIAAAPLACANAVFGWRSVLIGLGVVTALVAIAIWVFVRDPKEVGAAQTGSGLSGYLALLRIPVLWFIFPIMLVSYAATVGIRGLWAGPLLADVYGADAALIGRVTFFMALAMAIGSFAYGPLDTVFNTRKWVAFSGAALGAVAMAVMAFNPSSGIVTVTVLLVVIGLCGVGYGVIMAHAKAFFPPELTGRGVTLLNFFSIGGVAVLQMATGAVVTTYHDPANPVIAYQALFGFYAVVIAVALAVYAFSRDAKPAAK